jgi:hypothetical protein
MLALALAKAYFMGRRTDLKSWRALPPAEQDAFWELADEVLPEVLVVARPTARADLLAAALKLAPDDAVKQAFEELATLSTADGYDDETVVQSLLHGMSDGLCYGNWPERRKS